MKPEMFEVLATIDQTHWWFVARRAILRDVLAVVLPPSRQSCVLDVGCGTGANIASLAQGNAYRCIGIDTSPEAIQFAGRRFPDVRFVCGNAPDDLGNAMGGVDAILLMDVLEHVEGDRDLLARLVASVRPGALLIITVPADMRLWSTHDEQLGHFRRYDPQSLRALSAGLPVHEVMLTHFCSRLYAVARIQRLISRGRGASSSDAHWDMPVPARPVNALLRRIFAGESRRLVDLVRGVRRQPYSRGVSLMTLLRRHDAV